MWRLDILEIDGAECRFELSYSFHKAVDIGLVQFQIEYIDVGQTFEQDGHSLLHRLGGARPHIAQSGYG